jgi:hypothetical protein
MTLVSVAITGIQIAGAESAKAFSGQVRTSEHADTPLRPHRLLPALFLFLIEKPPGNIHFSITEIITCCFSLTACFSK